MSDIPEAYQRIRESRVESIIRQHLSNLSPFSSWIFREVLSAELIAVEDAKLHVDRDHRCDSGDSLAYGETDIEIIATVALAGRDKVRAGLLIETKVDARQTEMQGLRYRARASYRKQIGAWEIFRCILVAPQRYLESAYPLEDFQDAGWDTLISLEDVANILKREHGALADSAVINRAVEPTNAWNIPIPETAQFWGDLSRFQRAIYPDVPIFINRRQGAGVFVWPSFYENQLANNSREIRRKRVQIVHSGKTHVALYIKNVRFEDFEPVVRPLLEDGVHLGAPGGSWQSVNIKVPYVNPQLSLEGQADKVDHVFYAARRLFDFFIKHEKLLLGVRTFK